MALENPENAENIQANQKTHKIKNLDQNSVKKTIKIVRKTQISFLFFFRYSFIR